MMKDQEGKLADLRDTLDDVRATIEREREQVAAGESFGMNTRAKLVRYYIEDIEDRLERLEEIGGYGTEGVEFVLPPAEDQELESEETIYLRHSAFQIWGDAAFAFVDGRYSAAVFGFAACLEATLKHEFERRGENYGGGSANLGNCIDHAIDNIFPLDSEILEKAWEVKDIRNDVIHFNIERGMSTSELAEAGEVNKEVDVEGTAYVNDAGWAFGSGETVVFGETGTVRIEAYRGAAESVMEDVRAIRDFLYESAE